MRNYLKVLLLVLVVAVSGLLTSCVSGYAVMGPPPPPRPVIVRPAPAVIVQPRPYYRARPYYRPAPRPYYGPRHYGPGRRW